ncbi:MAG: arylsulfatase [Planctomycetes bacterium]|nr:arylsulfatase [Planctomycetota bacterium]
MSHHFLRSILGVAGILAVGWCATSFISSSRAAERPNIVLVMVDDMGYSDLGCYGGEIKTPNIDRLASRGIRFTQFYNCAKCETTRATLLSGQYHPAVGIRNLRNCVTIAEAMRAGGYTTLMTGKWHLKSTPIQRGFDRYFGHLSGACNFFTGDDTFRLDDKPFEVPKTGFYTTDANTDYAIRFLRAADKNKPFFLYVAYNAPHYPLQAPKEEVDKYRGKYKIGWDELRRRRLARMKSLGIVASNQKLGPRPADVPAWDTLGKAERDEHDLLMATYAGMIDRVDQNIGRLIAQLEKMEAWENTLLLFLSDNGACPFQRTAQKTRDEKLMPWDPASYWTYDRGWAHACNTPFRQYKQNQHEGGISTPLIAHWPQGIKKRGTITHQPGHLVDIMATCLDVGGVDYPKTQAGKPIGPLHGHSLAPIFAGKKRKPHEAIFFTFYGKNNALRMGDWKLVNIDRKNWELYNIARDRAELNDLAAKEPERLAAMKKHFERMAKEMGGVKRGGKKKQARRAESQ